MPFHDASLDAIFENYKLGRFVAADITVCLQDDYVAITLTQSGRRQTWLRNRFAGVLPRWRRLPPEEFGEPPGSSGPAD